MKKIVLIDGNNLFFRSYYATAYNGNLMKNSKDFPTNALYGFVTMINKILVEEQPEYMLVAFDKGKTFRHEEYKDYKAGRIETPKDLLLQFPYAFRILEALGIKALSIDNYEADDIVGTLSKIVCNNNEKALIISSDKDLLQLINNNISVKLLKTKDYLLLNNNNFKEIYGIEPIKIIDLKALQGDLSDNIPGVKGVGEKTALNLLQEYGSLEEIYNNIDNIKGKLKEKLQVDKENAFFSKKLATICLETPINISLEDIKIKDKNNTQLVELYNELEFYSFIKKETKIRTDKQNVNTIIVKDKITIIKPFSFYIELDSDNYHLSKFISLSIYDGDNYYYLNEEALNNNKEIFFNECYTYDLKKAIVVLNRYNIKINCAIDLMICSYLLNYNIKDDISYLANAKGYEIEFTANLIKDSNIIDYDKYILTESLRCKFIYETKQLFLEELKEAKMLDLYLNIEHPLINVLASMEIQGIKVDVKVIDELKENLKIKINRLETSIYNLSGETFNISSPKQLGEILFEKLNLNHGKKKGKNGYSTNHEALEKLVNSHPIIPLILEYRNLSKLMNTYMDNLSKYIMSDGKIHTIFKQTITRTGRLSSIEPNLQNIPVRSEEGKQIRKAFLPDNNSIILSSDYSQIELRILAHISSCKEMIEAFNNNEDIHTKVASDIFSIPQEAVTKSMRRTAKAVIFGIVYGISGFGLGENLQINSKDAKKFIDKYLDLYPGVKNYMNDIVIKAKNEGYVKTLMGRTRIIDELKNPNYIIVKSGERIALNTPIQGTAADIIKKAMIDVYEEINKRKLKSKLILQVHDELVFTIPIEEEKIMKELVKNIMEHTYKLNVPLIVEVDTGNNWYNVK